MNRNLNNMKQNRTGVFLIIGLSIAFFFLEGCVVNKKTNYLQVYDVSKYEANPDFEESYKLQASDNIFIRVVTPDSRYAEMFNTVPVASPGISATEQSVDLLSYVVQADGTVDIPYLGSIQVGGKTIEETKEILKEELTEYVADVSITVKLVNYYISILGEVTAPGRYPVYKQHLNIFQALAMAGDIDDFGNRYRVKMIRPTPEGSVIKEFDLTDRSVVDSDFYYVMPNDVIYVEPMPGKFFAMNQFPFALILTTISTTVLILSFVQR
jgi:polysaccharide biosynthesis/export protein